MGAPIGNQNARKRKLFIDAVHRRMVERYGSVEAGYDALADKTLDAASQGEQWALMSIPDRADGKPAQSVAIGGDEDAPPIKLGVVELVRPG